MILAGQGDKDAVKSWNRERKTAQEGRRQKIVKSFWRLFFYRSLSVFFKSLDESYIQ